ncbi:MAG: hypothetical protein ACRDPY_30655 [Streptosporangiaceae bacterium]
MTKWMPPLLVAELARTASHLARGARHIEATWGEPGAALPQREPARLDNLRIRLGASGHAHHAATTGRAAAAGSACQPPSAARIAPLADPQGNDVTGRWPLRTYLELGALPSAVSCARLHTRQLLWEWGMPATWQTPPNYWSPRS